MGRSFRNGPLSIPNLTFGFCGGLFYFLFLSFPKGRGRLRPMNGKRQVHKVLECTDSRSGRWHHKQSLLGCPPTSEQASKSVQLVPQ